MDVALLAQKNLSNLEGYIGLDNEEYKYLYNFLLNLQFLNKDETTIGFYRNQSLEYDFITITSQRVLVVNSERLATSIRYENIQDVHTEPTKGTNTIFIRQKDGSSDYILISGVKGDKFLDVYGFLRFLKKVIVNIKLNNTVSLTI
jgi:hypothetical protein